MLMGVGCENGYPSNANLGANRCSSFKPLSSRPGSAGPAVANTHSALMGTHAGEERTFFFTTYKYNFISKDAIFYFR